MLNLYLLLTVVVVHSSAIASLEPVDFQDIGFAINSKIITNQTESNGTITPSPHLTFEDVHNLANHTKGNKDKSGDKNTISNVSDSQSKTQYKWIAVTTLAGGSFVSLLAGGIAIYRRKRSKLRRFYKRLKEQSVPLTNLHYSAPSTVVTQIDSINGLNE